MTIPYEAAIHIKGINSVSPMLGGIMGEILRLSRAVDSLNGKFPALKQALVGLGAGFAGSEGKLVAHGNDLVKIQRDMMQATGSATDVQNAYNQAWAQTLKYQNMSAVEIMAMQNDARMTFGSQSIAMQHIQPFVEMASFLKAYEGHEKGSRDTESLMREINAAMKSGEIAGKITP